MNCPKCNQGISEGAHFCPECGAALVAAPEPVAREVVQGTAAQIEVSQQVETVEGGRVVGVNLGEVLGDVNIGNYTLRIGTLNGGVVNLAPPQQRWVPLARSIPVMLLPRPFSGFLDRREEVSAAAAVLEGASPVEFYGPSGVGKTTLLHHLAHHKFAPVFPAGIIFFSEIRHRPVDDLLLDFLDAFYERDPAYIPTRVQVRHALRDEHALVVLDDVDLEREEIEALMDAAPACVFLSASTERRLWSGGRTIALRGLPPEDALALIEHELGHPLGEEDRSIVQQLYFALEGYPLRLLQLSALVRDDGVSLLDVAERVLRYTGSAVEALTQQTLEARSEQEQRVLAALAVPMGASVGEEHMDALAGVADARPALESLQRRRLVQAHSPRYSLTGSLDEVLGEGWDLTPWNERALEHFATWAEEQRHAPDRVLEEADAILGVLQRSAQEERWAGTLRLGRATEGPLALRGHWGAWAQTLERELEAARQLGDRAAEAWCLHQSGTRALCLEDAPAARADLTEALRLRESFGDWAGAAVTRHNLNLLGGLGPDHGPEGSGGGGTGGLGSWPMIVGAIFVVAIMVLVGTVALGRGAWNPLSENGSPQREEQQPDVGRGQRPGEAEQQPGGGGETDIYESDIDEDGIVDGSDNCPDTPNAQQEDADEDGVGDACDESDRDDDGWPDDADNCPDASNPEQEDVDEDGVGDICDPTPNGDDSDGDGIPIAEDSCPDVPNTGSDYDGDGIDDACDPPPVDSDGDGVPDGEDSCPDAPNTGADFDGDGVDDACDPPPIDTDGDGIPDPQDSCPNSANTGSDYDGDGIDDACDPPPVVEGPVVVPDQGGFREPR